MGSQYRARISLNQPQRGTWSSRLIKTALALGMLWLFFWGLGQFYSAKGIENAKTLIQRTKRRPTAQEVEKSALPRPRVIVESPDAQERTEVDVSPTGNPELDIAYRRDPEWRARYEAYRDLSLKSQAEGRQAPAPPEAPWIVEERMQRSERWAPNPWGVEP